MIRRGTHIASMADDPINPDNLPADLPPKLPAVQEKKFLRDSARVEKGFLPKLRRMVAYLPFAHSLLSAYYAALDPKTPLHVKAVLMGALAYFVMPVDLIPDFIALLGYGDDATVLFAALRTVATNITPDHKDRAQTKLRDMRQEKAGPPKP
jgi:uncharacterized membrane protein YkvA (DUF1232 family)